MVGFKKILRTWLSLIKSDIVRFSVGVVKLSIHFVALGMPYIVFAYYIMVKDHIMAPIMLLVCIIWTWLYLRLLDAIWKLKYEER